MPEKIRSLGRDDIVILGHVPDLNNLFSRCKLSIAPLRYGAGVKGKIVTSLSYGVPCVATSIAVEGMGLEKGNNILVGDTPEEFSDAVVNLYTSPKLWMDLSESGLDLIHRKYSIDQFRINLKQLIEEL